MTRHSIPIALIILLWTGAALADGFAGNRLFVGRSVKPDSDEQKFAIGLDAKFSPMDIGMYAARDAARDAMVNQCQSAGLPIDCNSAVDQAFNTIADIPDSQWDYIQSLVGDPVKMEQELVKNGVPADSAAAVSEYVKNPDTDIPPEDALEMAKQLTRQKGVTILLEPWATMNFDVVEFSLALPMIVNAYSSSSDFTLGNFNTNLKFGGVWKAGPAAIGLSGGIHLYFPTAYQDRANAAAFGDLFQTPKYLHGYMSFAPYLVFGADLPFITIQTFAEIASQHRVWGNGVNKHVQYFKYGAALTILPDFVISIIGEIDGLVPINNASAYNTLFVVGGLRLKIVWFSFSAAVQAPVYGWNRNYSTDLGIKDFNQLSRISIIGRFAFTF